MTGHVVVVVDPFQSVSQPVSLVLTKLRIRYKGDHKCRLAANTGLTLLPLT